jgi:oxaloacetate decarboxylase alpha subunit
MVANLRALGVDARLDMASIEEVGEHFRRIAEQEGKPLGVPMAYDAFHYEHQLPGGMLTNLKYQLETVGLSARFDEVLAECARIRRELAWPIMVTPFAQLVGTQAVLNVVHGERYRVVPDEVKKYVLGYYGKLLAPVDPQVLDRIISNGSERIALHPVTPEPAVESLRRKYPDASDEERLLRLCFAGNQVDDMHAAGPIRTVYGFDQPFARLLKELAQRKSWHYVRLEGRGIDITLRGGVAS